MRYASLKMLKKYSNQNHTHNLHKWCLISNWSVSKEPISTKCTNRATLYKKHVVQTNHPRLYYYRETLSTLGAGHAQLLISRGFLHLHNSKYGVLAFLLSYFRLEKNQTSLWNRTYEFWFQSQITKYVWLICHI